MKYIKTIIATIALVSMLSIGSAAADSINLHSNVKFDIFSSSLVGDACNGLSQVAAGGNGCSGGGSSLQSIVRMVVMIMSWIVGILSIIMLLVAGIKYITSSGDSNAVASAKHTLLYALIGLFIAAIAQLLVHFALDTASSIQGSNFPNSYSQIRDDS